MEKGTKYLMKRFVETNYVTLNRGRFGSSNRTTYDSEIKIIDKIQIILDLKFTEYDDTKVSYNPDGSIVLEHSVIPSYNSIPDLDFRWFTYYKVTTVYEPIYDMEKAQDIVEKHKLIAR